MPRRKPRSRSGRKNRSGRRKGKQVGLSGLLLFVFLAVVCTGAIYWASQVFFDRSPVSPHSATRPADGRRPSPEPSAPQPPRQSSPQPSSPRVYEDFSRAPETETPGPPPEILPGDGARVAVVIDDLGRSVADLDTLDALGVPLTYAVLPFETHTPEVVAELRRRRREVLVHLPMEPANGANPGPGALTRAMGRRELVRATREALAAVPGAVGVNNHMGSGLSTDPRAMRTVLGVVAQRGLFFLDSRTTVDTVGYRVATSLGIPAAERQVFLDREPTPEEIAHQFRRLLALARERGSAIAIGHPHPETLDILASEIPVAVDRGYDFVPVSFLLQRPGGLPE